MTGKGKAIVYMSPRRWIGQYYVNRITAYGGKKRWEDESYVSGFRVALSTMEHDEYNPEFVYEYSFRSETDSLEPKNRQKPRYSHEERRRAKLFAKTIMRLLTAGIKKPP